MQSAQVRQQLAFFLLVNNCFGLLAHQAGVGELRDQALHRHLQDGRKLANGNFSHDQPPAEALSASANHGARAVMISSPARASVMPSISINSSTDSSARSSIVVTPFAASA